MRAAVRANRWLLGSLTLLLLAGAVGVIASLRHLDEDGPSVQGVMGLSLGPDGEVVVVVSTCSARVDELTITASTDEPLFDGADTYRIEPGLIGEDEVTRVSTGLTPADFDPGILFSMDARTTYPPHRIDPVKFFREDVVRLDVDSVLSGSSQGPRMTRDASGTTLTPEGRFVEGAC